MITDQIMDYVSHSKTRLEGEEVDEDDLKIYMWPTPVGHMVVVEGPEKDVCVYGNGRFKFHLIRPTQSFWEHVMKREL